MEPLGVWEEWGVGRGVGAAPWSTCGWSLLRCRRGRGASTRGRSRSSSRPPGPSGASPAHK
eukprot:762609-Prymnesium_polylepis.1